MTRLGRAVWSFFKPLQEVAGGGFQVDIKVEEIRK